MNEYINKIKKIIIIILIIINEGYRSKAIFTSEEIVSKPRGR